MCMECRQIKCPPACPNVPEPPVVCRCYSCGDLIRDGDTFYNIEGTNYCKCCIDNCRETAEAENEM